MLSSLGVMQHAPEEEAACPRAYRITALASSATVTFARNSLRVRCSFASNILASYDYPISTGPLEGTNTKIQVLKRQAYGFRDREFFKLKIRGIHETKHALVG